MMQTPEPGLTPALEQLVDDLVRQRLEARLHEIFLRAAEEIYAQDRRISGDSYSSRFAVPQADEIREPAVSVEHCTPDLSYALIDIFERATRATDPTVSSRGALEARMAPTAPADLPSTLRELREQSLSTTEAAARLGVNSSRIRQRLLARTLYGFKDGGSWRVPEFQFDGDHLVSGVESVFPEIRSSVSPITVARWFVLPWEDLVVDEDREIVVSPRAWLLEGRDPAPVISQAHVL